MGERGRMLVAAVGYLLLLIYGIFFNYWLGRLDLLFFVIEHHPDWLLTRPSLLLYWIGMAALAVLIVRTLTMRLRTGEKRVCTAVYIVGILMPYVENWRVSLGWLSQGALPGPMLAALVCCAAALLIAFVWLKNRVPDAPIGEGESAREPGYYEDLYRQGVITRQEYEEMTSHMR